VAGRPGGPPYNYPRAVLPDSAAKIAALQFSASHVRKFTTPTCLERVSKMKLRYSDGAADTACFLLQRRSAIEQIYRSLTGASEKGEGARLFSHAPSR